MSLWQEIKNAAQGDPTGDPKALASRLYRRLGRAEIVSLLAAEIAHEQRGCARATEVAAFRGAFTTKLTDPAAKGDESAFAALFGTRFALGDGTEATWDKATIEQHEQRIAMLEKLRNGLDRTIQRHRDAVAILRSTGARCLAEVDAQAA